MAIVALITTKHSRKKMETEHLKQSVDSSISISFWKESMVEVEGSYFGYSSVSRIKMQDSFYLNKLSSFGVIHWIPMSHTMKSITKAKNKSARNAGVLI